MKWVGRVLLCVLIASTLFALKPSDFQTKSAYAQTSQDCNSVVLALDIELLRNIGGSQINLTNAINCARITGPGQDPTIYYRLIVQFGNNVSQTSFTNWLVGVNQRVGYPSIDAAACAIGSNTADPFQPLPQSWSCTSSYTGLPSFPEGSNLKAWVNIGEVLTATLAANPNHVSAGGSTTLSWNSPRAQQLSIDQGIGNVARPSGSRQVNNIRQETTYTLTAVGYTDVVQSQATVTIDLPDFVMDLSSAQTYVNGSPIAPTHLYLQMGAFEIRDVTIKNIGNGAAPPGAVLVAIAPNEAERNLLPDFEGSDLFETLITENIEPGGQLTLPPIRIDMNNSNTKKELRSFTALLSKEGSVNKAALVASVNYDYDNYEPVVEISNENNASGIGNFFDWQAFEITVVGEKDGQTSPLSTAKINVIVRGVYLQFAADYTDDLGKSYVTMAANSIPGASYTFIASTRSFAGQAEKDVSSFTYETVQIKIDLSEGLVINTAPMLLSKDDADTYVEWYEGISSGTAQITADNEIVYTAPILSNRAIFRGIPKTVKTVSVDKITNTISFRLGTWQSAVKYTWDATKDGKLSFDNDLNSHKVEMKLIRTCDTQLLPTIKACFYNDQEKIEEYKESVLPTYAKSLQKLTDGFDPSVQLKNVREVWLVSYYGGGATITPITRTPLVFRLWTAPGKFGEGDELLMADLITHEAMHALDAQLAPQPGTGTIRGFPMFSESDPFYKKSVSLTAFGLTGANITGKTGRWAWKNLGATCSVMPQPSRSKCAGHDNPRDGAAEIFAEQATAACLFPKETAATFRNYSGIYAANPMRDSNGLPLPEPPDLQAHRDIIASRSINIGIPEFGTGKIIYDIDSSWRYTIGYSSILQAIMSSCAK